MARCHETTLIGSNVALRSSVCSIVFSASSIELDRAAGLEPASSRRQRDGLAAGRCPQVVSARGLEPLQTTSVALAPILGTRSNRLHIGAGGGNRTRVSALEAHRAATTPRPLPSRALH